MEAKFHHSPFSKEHEQFARAAKHQGSAGKEGGVVGAWGHEAQVPCCSVNKHCPDGEPSGEQGRREDFGPGSGSWTGGCEASLSTVKGIG